MVLLGAPRTKKNHGRRIWRRDRRTGRNRPYHIPSAAHELWHDKAMWRAREAAALAGWAKATTPVHVRALVYRHALVGDLNGYQQAIGDMLEHAGVLDDDKLIASWDGSRLLKDAGNPRVELEIEIIGAPR
jgi:Holliday junction resolvase RusA-like endonuclease